MELQHILARRTDLSTFLVHLTRDVSTANAREAFEGILQSGRIEARSVFGAAKVRLEKSDLRPESQKTVCFTETPLEFTHLLLEEIPNRGCQFKPYGIAVTKRIGRQKGVNPVWYVDISPGHDWIIGGSGLDSVL